MDRKFDSDRQWFISPLVNLQAFLRAARHEYIESRRAFELPLEPTSTEEDLPEEHASLTGNPDLDAAFLRVAGCNKRTARNIAQDLDLSNLVDDEQRPMKLTFDALNSDDNLRPDILKTHKHAAARVGPFKNHQKKHNYTRNLKYYRCDKYGSSLRQWSPKTSMPAPPDDFIVTVHICRPYNRILNEVELRSTHIMTAQSKVIVRGSTSLLSLRRCIQCVSDLGSNIEPGEELKKPEVEQCHITLFPSAFLFIHDTFYIDYTLTNAQDISEEIRKFMKRKTIFDPTTSRSIEGVCMRDLTIRLGQPYVMQHSGNCEHLIVFTDLRLITKDDEQDSDKYPIRSFEKGGEIRCYACKLYDATMCVEDCSRLPMTPAFFCDKCFKSFHFVHSKKIGEFRAFPFFQMSRLLT